MTRTLFFPLTLGLAGLAVACGSLDGNADQHTTTLATMQGEIAKPDNVKLGSGQLRVALVWENVSSDGGKSGLRVAQDVPVTPSFPAQFQLTLTEPPPEEVMFASKGSPSLRAAVGWIVAYEDVNGNGKLDLVDPSNPTPIDKVVGWPSNENITYLEGDPASLANGADDMGAHAAPGYDLYEIAPQPDVSCAAAMGADAASSPCPGFLWKPITTPITITLSNSHGVASVICGVDPGATSVGTVVSHMKGELPAMLPDKSDPNVSCSQDGRSYTYETCMDASPNVCDPVERCSADTYTLADGAMPPSGWPCTVK